MTSVSTTSSSAAPLYRAIAEHLPPFFQEDADSYDEVTGFLGLIDALFREEAAQIDAIAGWLTPDARRQHPPGLPPGADSRTVFARYEALFDELARWVAFRFPESWEGTNREETLNREQAFLLRAARIWRRRGTPRGFVAWMCLYFRLWTRVERPLLIEHFKYRPAGDRSGEHPGDPDPWAHRVTLLVPLTSAFSEYERRREAVQFVNRHLPAHLLARVCWVPEGFAIDLADGAAVRALLDEAASIVPWADGVHLRCDPLDAVAIDRLGTGQLPTGAPTDASDGGT